MEETRQAWLRQVSEAAAQEEMNRLARDLHDSIKQQIFSIHISAAAAQARWAADPEGSRPRRRPRVVQTGLRSYLTSFEDIEVIGAASSGEEALAKLGEWVPDVMVMDLHMPGGIDGVETTRRVPALSPHTQVVVLTAHTDEARVVAALRTGAIGYVRKDLEPEVLVAAVRGAARGQSVLDPAVAGSVLQELMRGGPLAEDLSEREKEVLAQLAHGRTHREIALALNVGEETVKTHVGNILLQAPAQPPHPGGDLRAEAGSGLARRRRDLRGRAGSRGRPGPRTRPDRKI